MRERLGNAGQALILGSHGEAGEHGGAGAARVPRRPARAARRCAGRAPRARGRAAARASSAADRATRPASRSRAHRPGRRSRAAATGWRSPRRCAATPAARRAGCSCASSGRRPSSAARARTPRSPTSSSPTATSRRPRRPRRCAPTCSTPTSRACATPSARSRPSLAGDLPVTAAQQAALAQGFWRVLAASYRAQVGAAAEAAAGERPRRARRARRARGGRPQVTTLVHSLSERLDAFRAAPLSAHEQRRRASQVRTFTPLVSVEYGRGVANGRVLRDFEIQEAITFQSGALSAFHDIEPMLLKRDARRGARHRQLARAARQRSRGRLERQARGRPGRARAAHEGDHRGDRHALPEGLAEARRERRLRPHRRLARPHAEGRRGRAVPHRRAGPDRGLRVLRARARAAPARPGARALHPQRGPLLVRLGLQRRPRDADQRPRLAGGDRRHPRRAQPRAERGRGSRRHRARRAARP